MKKEMDVMSETIRGRKRCDALEGIRMRIKGKK